MSKTRRPSALDRALGHSRKAAATRALFARVGFADDAAELDRLVRANLCFTVAYYARYAALLTEVGRRRLRRSIAPVGLEHLLEATMDGRGAILLSAHLGDFDLAGHWVAERTGSPLVAVSPPVWPRWRQALYRTLRRRCGFVVRAQADSTLEQLTQDLEAGHLVLFLADRRVHGRAVAGELLGLHVTQSAAPALLATAANVPIVTAATWTAESGSRLVRFGAPQWCRSAADAQWCQPALADLELAVRQAPHQWHVPADPFQMAL